MVGRSAVTACALAFAASARSQVEPIFDRLDGIQDAAAIAVDGHAISRVAAQRRALHLFLPSSIDDWVVGRMLRAEAERRGLGEPTFDAAACDAAGARWIDRLAGQFPAASGAVLAALGRAAGHRRLWLEALFFPADGGWPAATFEVLEDAHPNSGSALRTRLEKLARPLPEPTATLLDGWLRSGLRKRAKVTEPGDGITADTCLIVDRHPWPVRAAWDELGGLLQSQQLRVAWALLAIERAASAAVEPLDDDAFARRYEIANPRTTRYRLPPLQPIPLGDRVSRLSIISYPERRVFRPLWRLRLAHDAMFETELDVTMLAAHADALRRRTVALDYIRFTARDRETGAWREALQRARGRAERVARQIRAGTDFDAARREHGEWYFEETKSGILNSCDSLGQLRQLFGENELTDLVFATSAAEHAFLHAPIGEVAGPLPTPSGAVLVRVRSRLEGEHRPSPEQVRERALQAAFVAWTRRMIASASVEIRYE